MLSRFVTPFLPKSKRLLILWLQSVSAVILKPPVWGQPLIQERSEYNRKTEGRKLSLSCPISWARTLNYSYTACPWFSGLPSGLNPTSDFYGAPACREQIVGVFSHHCNGTQLVFIKSLHIYSYWFYVTQEPWLIQALNAVNFPLSTALAMSYKCWFFCVLIFIQFYSLKNISYCTMCYLIYSDIPDIFL